MNTHDIKRYAVSGDIAYPIHEDPEGDYVTYEDHVAAIEADRLRRGEPVAWAMFSDDGNIRLWSKNPMPHPKSVPLYTDPQPAEHNIDYKELYEQMCNRCDSLDAKLAEYERRGEPYAQLIVVNEDDEWPQLVYLKGVNLEPGVHDLFLSPQPAETEPCFCDRMYPDSNPDASCGDCPTRDYKEPAEPMKVPSDAELEKAWDSFEAEMARHPTDDELEEFMAQFADEMGHIHDDQHAEAARALLARYTTTKEQP